MRFFAVLLAGSALCTGCRLDIQDDSEASQSEGETAEVLSLPGTEPKELFDLPAEERALRFASLLEQFVGIYASELVFDHEPAAKRNDDQIVTMAFDAHHRAAGVTFHVEVSVLEVGYVDVRFSDADGHSLRETSIGTVDPAWGAYANGLPHLGKTVKAYCTPLSGF